MVFVTAGLGGGTGTGAAPIVAQIAGNWRSDNWRRCVPSPSRAHIAQRLLRSGASALKEHADTLIVIPNDRLLQIVDKRSGLQDAFKVADDVLRQGVRVFRN